MLQSFGTDAVERGDDRFSQRTAVVGAGPEVGHNLFGPDFQHAGRWRQLSEVVVVIAVIVVGFLKGWQRLVEQIPGGDPQPIQQALVLAVQFHHLGLDHRIQAQFLGPKRSDWDPDTRH